MPGTESTLPSTILANMAGLANEKLPSIFNFAKTTQSRLLETIRLILLNMGVVRGYITMKKLKQPSPEGKKGLNQIFVQLFHNSLKFINFECKIVLFSSFCLSF